MTFGIVLLWSTSVEPIPKQVATCKVPMSSRVFDDQNVWCGFHFFDKRCPLGDGNPTVRDEPYRNQHLKSLRKPLIVEGQGNCNCVN